MSNHFISRENGYTETIRQGISAVQSFRPGVTYSTGSREDNISRLKSELETADAILIGAGAGLSTSAGLTYSGERFDRYFFDFKERFGITDMYSGGFFPFPDEQTRWAWWARHIYFNRYAHIPKPVYDKLLELVRGKDYFVVTTNVDHCFQRAGFEKDRLFYTQGDYGLFQSANGHIKKTYDNEAWVMRAMAAQGFVLDEYGAFQLPETRAGLSMRLPRELIPRCPDDGGAVTMNLRSDDTFVEDAGWHKACAGYSAFLSAHQGLHVLYLELGVGGNTPVIIKYPFWAMTAENPKVVYACLNYNEAFTIKGIEDRSICIDGDISSILKDM